MTTWNTYLYIHTFMWSLTTLLILVKKKIIFRIVHTKTLNIITEQMEKCIVATFNDYQIFSNFFIFC